MPCSKATTWYKLPEVLRAAGAVELDEVSNGEAEIEANGASGPAPAPVTEPATVSVAEPGDAAAAPSTGVVMTKNQKKRAREKQRKQTKKERRQLRQRQGPGLQPGLQPDNMAAVEEAEAAVANAAVDAATTRNAEMLGYEEARYPRDAEMLGYEEAWYPSRETVLVPTASQGGASKAALSYTKPLSARGLA